MPWDGWLIIAGRGWGKTRTGAEAVRDEVESGRSKRIGLISETAADGRDVLVEGESGILACSPPWNRPTFVKADGRPKLHWLSGAIATLYDAREPDQLRGPQHDFIWFDELAKFRYADDVFDMAMFGLRLGEHPRWMATTTPRPIALIRGGRNIHGVVVPGLIRTPGVVVTRGRTDDNLSNIAPSFKTIIDRYKGTRIGRQEIEAEILEDVPGALWTRRMLDEGRVKQEDLPELTRIIVAVDPAASSDESANENGIVVVGVGFVGGHQHGYVLDDWSVRGTPDEWGRKAVAAYRMHGADRIVIEKNMGGEMAEHVVKSVDRMVPVTMVSASRGKLARAEPVSALYEQGRVHHVGTLGDLEDQMISWTPQSALATAAASSRQMSPDRVDALVWGLTELFPNITAAERNPAKPPPSHTNSNYSPTRAWIRPGPTRANMR